jgi:hypothetical protein
MGFISLVGEVSSGCGCGIGTPWPIDNSAQNNFHWFKVLCNSIHEISRSYMCRLLEGPKYAWHSNRRLGGPFLSEIVHRLAKHNNVYFPGRTWTTYDTSFVEPPLESGGQQRWIIHQVLDGRKRLNSVPQDKSEPNGIYYECKKQVKVDEDMQHSRRLISSQDVRIFLMICPKHPK